MGDLIRLPGTEDLDLATLRFTGEILEWADSVCRRRDIADLRALVETGFALVKLVDQMDPSEYLAVVHTSRGRVGGHQPIAIPWRENPT